MSSPTTNQDTHGSQTRRGNIQRAECREKCRRLLATHLEMNLGLHIDPKDVRLMPDAQDGYRWSRRPEMERLFKKALSKLSMGDYMTLCREIGHSFEAVAANGSTQSPRGTSYSEIKFLQEENETLKREIEEIKGKAEENETLKRGIEEIKGKADEHSQLSQQLQTYCQILRAERDRSHAKVAKTMKQITKLASNLASASTSAAETHVAMPALERSLLLNQPPNEKEPSFEQSDTESSSGDTDRGE